MALIADLAARVDALADRAAVTEARVLIGIAGPPGVGKSTLAARLTRRLAGADDWRGTRAAHVPMDGFHLADVELERRGLRQVKGVPATFDAAGYLALLTRIRAGKQVMAPSFERDLDQPVAGALPVGPETRIVVSEGNYLLLPDDPWPRVRACFDEVWYCRLDPLLRRGRLRERRVRHGQSREQAERWLAEVDEPNAALVEATEPEADLVLDLP